MNQHSFETKNRSRISLLGAASGTRFTCGRLIALLIILTGRCLALAASPASSPEAKVIFRQRCVSCHTFGKGVKVGPDLKGVTERRTRDWLLRFVRGSSSVIQSGDPIATKLYREFKQERMPDWSDLSSEQVVALLDYFAADGPLQQEPDERDATTATASEIEMGRKLFQGAMRFNSGARSCQTCHAVRDPESSGGTLGPDLTSAYSKYRDRALTDFLRRPCFPREPESSASRYLTPEESFDLKAYMAKVSGLRIPLPPTASSTPLKGVDFAAEKRRAP